jgi:hypothetical protein
LVDLSHHANLATTDDLCRYHFKGLTFGNLDEVGRVLVIVSESVLDPSDFDDWRLGPNSLETRTVTPYRCSMKHLMLFSFHVVISGRLPESRQQFLIILHEFVLYAFSFGVDFLATLCCFLVVARVIRVVALAQLLHGREVLWEWVLLRLDILQDLKLALESGGVD